MEYTKLENPEGKPRNKCFAVVALVVVVSALCLTATHLLQYKTRRFVDVDGYLAQFGYIYKNENINNTGYRSRSIKRFQRFAHLPITGVIDDESMDLMLEPRCGVPDMTMPPSKRVKRYNLHDKKLERINLRWAFLNRTLPSLNIHTIRQILRDSFAVWSNNSQLTFHESTEGRADIKIAFYRLNHNDGNSFDGFSGALAHAFYPGTSRSSEIHFDADENWNFGYDESGTNFRTVAVHEIGHALGLYHSADNSSIMYPWYSLIPDYRQIPEDDRLAIQALYGAKKDFSVVHTAITTPNVSAHKKTPNRRFRVLPLKHKVRRHCYSKYDAISLISEQLFIFKDDTLWRFDNDRQLMRGYPAKIVQQWRYLPANLTRVDAVFQNAKGEYVFFIGSQQYIINRYGLLPDYPKHISTLGIRHRKVDAAFKWGPKNKVHVVAGSMFYVLNTRTGKAEKGYPKNMDAVFRSVPLPVDAAFRDIDGDLYFLKNTKYWQINNKTRRVVSLQGKHSGPKWMCPRRKQQKQ